MVARRPLVLDDDDVVSELDIDDDLLGVKREVYAQAGDPIVELPSINFKFDAGLNVAFMRVFIP